jgi:hypothetical protein
MFLYLFELLQVCASNDPRAFSYNIQIRLQPPRVEIIQDMEAIIRAQLLYFYNSTSGYKPERIIFYRDGVSEGQFLQVCFKHIQIHLVRADMPNELAPGRFCDGSFCVYPTVVSPVISVDSVVPRGVLTKLSRIPSSEENTSVTT